MKRKFLIADDDPLARQIIREALQKCLPADSFEVAEASTGEDAVALCDTYGPHLIFMDLSMPEAELSGFEACQEIREKPGFEPLAQGGRVPILVVSAKARGTDVSYAREVGADDYLFKEGPTPLGEQIRQCLAKFSV